MVSVSIIPMMCNSDDARDIDRMLSTMNESLWMKEEEIAKIGVDVYYPGQSNIIDSCTYTINKTPNGWFVVDRESGIGPVWDFVPMESRAIDIDGACELIAKDMNDAMITTIHAEGSDEYLSAVTTEDVIGWVGDGIEEIEALCDESYYADMVAELNDIEPIIVFPRYFNTDEDALLRYSERRR